MIRRILLLLVVLAIPAGLATASQMLANTANPPLPHQHPIVVEIIPIQKLVGDALHQHQFPNALERRVLQSYGSGSDW